MDRLDHDEVRAHVAADAGTLYDLVSDITRTPEWSREVISCAWLDGAVKAVPGARFRARNRRRWLTWSNTPVVDVAEPGRQFAFTRTERGGGSIQWYYRLESESGGTITHGYRVTKPVPVGLHLALRLLFGVQDLRSDLRANMEASLSRLAALAAETSGSRR